MIKANTRYERGQFLAATSRIRKILPRTTKAQLWKVPSMNRKGIEYNVIFNNDELTCDCPDFTRRHELCKHAYGVIISEIGIIDATEQ